MAELKGVTRFYWIPGGFPPLDQNGNIISGQTVDYQVTTDILAYGATNFTTNFAPQNDALSSTFLWSGITQYAGTIPIGFQTVSAMGSGLSQATTPAVNAGADFLELYASDVTDPALQSYIQSLNASLLAN